MYFICQLKNVILFSGTNAVGLTKKIAQLFKVKAKRTDFRIKIMNELLIGIQVIKTYAWEKPFAKIVNEIRK